MPFSPVPPGTAGFLIIAFYTFGDVMVYDIPDIRFINPHPKSNGSDHHIHFLHKEHVLVFGSCFGVKPGVVGYGRDAIYLQHLREFFHPLSA